MINLLKAIKEDNVQREMQNDYDKCIELLNETQQMIREYLDKQEDNQE